jgi:hypothetical protein
MQPILSFMCAHARPSDCASLTALSPNSMHILLCMTSARLGTLIFHPCRLHAGPQMQSMPNTSSHGQLLRLRCAQLLKRADNVRRCLRASRQWAAACLFRHSEWSPAAPHLVGTRQPRPGTQHGEIRDGSVCMSRNHAQTPEGPST